MGEVSLHVTVPSSSVQAKEQYSTELPLNKLASYEKGELCTILPQQKHSWLPPPVLLSQATQLLAC
jgi:hypothetical protein